MRLRLTENEKFDEIADLLEDDDDKLAKMPFKEKHDYLGLFEEVDLMMNSRLIKMQVEHYMFGYYAARRWESENFWRGGLNRESEYWSVFRNFAEQMSQLEKQQSFNYNNKHFRV